MDDRTTLLHGTLLDGTYRILRVIGCGGFGITYEAEDVQLGNSVAVKEYYPIEFGDRDATMSVRAKSERHQQTFEWGRTSFLREARLLARFKHPSIVRVIRIFEAHQTAYMVMDFEQGQSIESWLQSLGRPPTQEELDRIIVPLLDALEVLHQRDFLHRDIAPDNIIVREDGFPVLLDFGAARHAIASMSRTLTGIVKAGYSPHEQYSSDNRFQGPWSDIYALGGTFYRAVTGRPPEEATMRMDRDLMPPATQSALGSYRASFLSAIDACLKMQRSERPQSVAELRPLLLGNNLPDWGGRSGSTKRTWGWRAMAAAAVLVAAGVGGSYTSQQRSWHADRRPAASTQSEKMASRQRAASEEEQRREQAARSESDVRKRKADEDADRRAAAERRRAEEEAEARAEVKRKEERAALETERRREEARRAEVEAEKRRDEEEAMRSAEAERRRAEAKRREDERRRIALEDTRRREEIHRADIEAERRRAEEAERRAAKARKRTEEEAAIAEEKRRKAAAGDQEPMTAEAERALLPKTVFTDCKNCPEMVVVPRGEFLMGSQGSERGRLRFEGPVHRVAFSKTFAVGKHAVTRGEFKRFVAVTNYSVGQSCHAQTSTGWSDKSGRSFLSPPGLSQDDNHPAVCVSWNDAVAYVEWLAALTKKPYRLPTEAEREYVARAGTMTSYWWGDTIDHTKANYDTAPRPSGQLSTTAPAQQQRAPGTTNTRFVEAGVAEGNTKPVGWGPPNPWGFFQVHGNVAEWVQDCWNPDYRDARRDGTALLTGDCAQRGLRGGAWSSWPEDIRSAYREMGPVTDRYASVGFRVARDLGDK